MTCTSSIRSKYNDISEDICISCDEDLTNEKYSNSGGSNNPDELDEMTEVQVKNMT